MHCAILLQRINCNIEINSTENKWVTKKTRSQELTPNWHIQWSQWDVVISPIWQLFNSLFMLAMIWMQSLCVAHNAPSIMIPDPSDQDIVRWSSTSQKQFMLYDWSLSWASTSIIPTTCVNPQSVSQPMNPMKLRNSWWNRKRFQFHTSSCQPLTQQRWTDPTHTHFA